MRGKFIVLEGIDGCGKDTQAFLLGKYLAERNKNKDILITREPTGEKYGKLIRQMMKEGTDPKENAELYTKLFVKDRWMHLKKKIIPCISRGDTAISIRYMYSTIGYQQTQGMQKEELIAMHKKMLIPDITILLDLPVETAIERVGKDKTRSYKEVFEKEKNFQEVLRQNYIKMASLLPEHRIFAFNAEKSPAAIFEGIKKITDRILHDY